MYSVKKMINGLVCVALTTFTGSLVHAQEGVWRDSTTGLSWMRCSIGQKWTCKTCAGEPLKFTWPNALDFAAALNHDGGFAGRTDWRVPTIDELSTIRKCSSGWGRGRATLPNGQSVPKECAAGSSRPTLNTSIFPNTKDSFYWSSSPVANYRDFAWIVGFGHGYDDHGNKYYNYYVRLVRSSQ